MRELTPWQRHGGHWVKRDDLYSYAGVAGGKVRTCLALARGARGLVTAGSRQSPQVNIVAQVARSLDIPCQVHVPDAVTGPTPELKAAFDAGAAVVFERPGHNSVIIARAREAATELGWRYIPFGMECQEAVEQTRRQVRDIPPDVRRLVVPVGSGMTLAGVLEGLDDIGSSLPVLGVVVGADPAKRLLRYGPLFWQGRCALVRSPLDYHEHAPDYRLGALELDPVYEAKCLPYLRPGDALWVVGIRQTAQQPSWRISAAWARHRVNCTPQGIRDNCKGRCCTAAGFWPGRSGAGGVCPRLGPEGCTLPTGDRPVTCLLFPLKVNRYEPGKVRHNLTLYNRVPMPPQHFPCGANYGHGPLVIEAIAPSLVLLFGQAEADRIVAEVRAGRDVDVALPADVAASVAMEERWAAEGVPPIPRREALLGVGDA